MSIFPAFIASITYLRRLHFPTHSVGFGKTAFRKIGWCVLVIAMPCQIACNESESARSKQNRQQPIRQTAGDRLLDDAGLYLPSRLLGAAEAFNKRDFANTVAHLSENALLTERSSGAPSLRGRADIRSKHESFVTLFPDATITPIRVLAGPDWALVESELSGSQKKQMGALASHGKRFSLQGASLHRFVGSQVVETHVYADTHSVVAQLRDPSQGEAPASRKARRECEIVHALPEQSLETALRTLVSVWFGLNEAELQPLTTPDIRYSNHMWRIEGLGHTGLTKRGHPVLGRGGKALVQFGSVYSTGNWTLAEVSVRPAGSPPDVQSPLSVSVLVVARFDGPRAQEIHLYGNSRSLRDGVHHGDAANSPR